MNKIFTKEVKIALTVILSAIVLVVGIDYLKGVNLMKPTNYYNVVLDNVNGLNLSAPVFVEGFKVGLVREMTYDDNTGKINVEVDLEKSFKLSTGSYAELSPDILGTAVLSLKVNRSSDTYYQPGDTIEGRMDYNLMSNLETDLLPKISSMMPKIDSILTGINALVNDPAISESIARLNNITADLETSSRELSVFMTSTFPSISSNIDTASAGIKNLTYRIDKLPIESITLSADSTLLNIKNITDRLNSNTNTLGLLLNDRSMYDGILHTVSSADSLLIDLKSHPKRYVHFSLFGGKNK